MPWHFDLLCSAAILMTFGLSDCLTVWLSDRRRDPTAQKSHPGNCLAIHSHVPKTGEKLICMGFDWRHTQHPLSPAHAFILCIYVLMGLWPDLTIINKLSRAERTQRGRGGVRWWVVGRIQGMGKFNMESK